MEWLEKTLYEKIVELWKDLETAYERFDLARDTIVEYFRPDMDTEVGSEYDGSLLGHQIYEGSPFWCAQTMATGFQSNQLSKNIDWLYYKFRSQNLQGIDRLDQWCQDVRDYNSQVYQRGNFYDIQPQLTLNAITLGSPVMFGEEDIATGEIFWIPIHYKNFRLFYDRFNRCEGIICKEKWRVKKIFDRFCEGRTIQERLNQAEQKFSISLYDAIENGRWQQEFTVYRAVFLKTHPLWENVAKLPNQRYSWFDVWLEETNQLDKRAQPLEFTGYFSKPFVVWDYDKKINESCSRTPAFYAVYDNLALQRIFKNYLENVEQKVRPAQFILEEMKNKIDYRPGMEIPVSRSQWNYLPKPLENIGDVRLELEQANVFKENLERHFFISLFRIMTSLAEMKRQPLTATQILEIAGEKITLLSPMLESHDNYLKQVDERVMEIESRAGRGPFAPDVIAEIIEIIVSNAPDEFRRNGVKLVPEFIGKLRRSQQMEMQLRPIRLGIAIAQEIGQTLDPDLPRLAIRGYETLDDGLRAVSFPLKNLRPRAEYESLASELAAGRAAQQQFQNMLEAAKASKSLNKTIEQNSPMALLTGG